MWDRIMPYNKCIYLKRGISLFQLIIMIIKKKSRKQFLCKLALVKLELVHSSRMFPEYF